MAQYQGTDVITVNGQEYPSLEGATFKASGANRETVKGARVYGFSETPQEATLECKMPYSATLSLDEIRGWKDVTVVFKPDVGRSHMMANAWVSDTPDDSDKGEVNVKFAAVESKEI
ncbi:phage tail tube protein [Klebsiella pneumoniae]|nr:phage tail tube protein [Klebsiella pneumoniae]